MSETSKQRQHTVQFCQGNGCDVASGGDPVVDSAIQIELPTAEYLHYNSGKAPATPIHWQGHAHDLPFKNDTLDYLYSSHLIEDYSDWEPLFREWTRVIKPGGFLVILAPEKSRWDYAVKKLGQCPNCAHLREPKIGEFTREIIRLGLPLDIVEDRLTNSFEHDYSLLLVARKR